LNLIEDEQERNLYLKKLIFTADGHRDLIGDPQPGGAVGFVAGAPDDAQHGAIFDILHCTAETRDQLIRGAAEIAQRNGAPPRFVFCKFYLTWAFARFRSVLGAG
jgi:hypothetical protein